MTHKIDRCRACGGDVSLWLQLEAIYPSGFVPSDFDYRLIRKVPLSLVQCSECSLVQSEWSVHRDDMYKQYWYESGINASMREALRDIVQAASLRVQIEPGDSVLDIECNDGTMLSFFDKTTNTIGFDPAANLAGKAASNCTRFINDYFPSSSCSDPIECKVVTTIAMFYDLEDPSTFVEQLKLWLHQEGIWIIQLADLRSMVSTNAFDNIVHEHLEHWSLKALKKFLKGHGIDIFDVEYNKVNGGSLRAYCCHENQREVKETVLNALLAEAFYVSLAARDCFAACIRAAIDKTSAVAAYLNSCGRRMAAIGASTKGNTFLQLARLDAASVSKIGEVNSAKYGLLTIGSKIPIVSETEVLEDQNAECLLVLPWHFIEGIAKKSSAFLARGGKLLCAMPIPRVITNSGITSVWYL